MVFKVSKSRSVDRKMLSPCSFEGRQKPLEEGFWKLNIDAAQLENSQRGKSDWIIPDWNGHLIGGSFNFSTSCWPVKVLEAKAIVKGLVKVRETWNGRNSPLVVESNSLEAINLLNCKDGSCLYGGCCLQLSVLMFFLFVKFLERKTKLLIIQQRWLPLQDLLGFGLRPFLLLLFPTLSRGVETLVIGFLGLYYCLKKNYYFIHKVY